MSSVRLPRWPLPLCPLCTGGSMEVGVAGCIHVGVAVYMHGGVVGCVHVGVAGCVHVVYCLLNASLSLSFLYCRQGDQGSVYA